MGARNPATRIPGEGAPNTRKIPISAQTVSSSVRHDTSTCQAHESAMGIFDMSIVGRPLPLVLAVVAMLLEPRTSARAFDVVLNAQGEFMDAYLVNGQAFPPKVVFIDPDPANPDSLIGPPPRVGRHVNGKLCFFPRGVGHNGDF